MASKIDIWNLALSHIGHKANIVDPDETSVEANHCRRFYPIALNVALERYDWSFASRRVSLAEVTNPLDNWEYAYALPNPCIKARKVLLPESTDDDNVQPFVIETDSAGDAVLYTNVETAVLKYTTLVIDTSKFTPLFVMAISYDLASMLCGPVPKDPKLKKAMLDAAVFYTGQAEAADGNAALSDNYTTYLPAHMAVR